MNERQRSQTILDTMFSCLSRVHAGDNVPIEREACMEWARRQLHLMGVEVEPRGMSDAVLTHNRDDIT